MFSIKYHSEMTDNDMYFMHDDKDMLKKLYRYLYKAFIKSIEEENPTALFTFCDDNAITISDDDAGSEIISTVSFRY